MNRYQLKTNEILGVKPKAHIGPCICSEIEVISCDFQSAELLLLHLDFSQKEKRSSKNLFIDPRILLSNHIRHRFLHIVGIQEP